MKLFATMILAAGICMNAWAENDYIILKNGMEKEVKLRQITDNMIYYSNIGGTNASFEEIPSKDVYMVHIEDQGNIYITEEGKRVTGELVTFNRKKFNAIYLAKGGEIPAENVVITESHVNYANKKKLTLKNLFKVTHGGVGSFEKADVFMVRYKNGITDVITPFGLKEEVEKKDTVVVEEVKEPEFVVIFYAVVRGETLESIANKFHVTPDEIIEWNELPASVKPASRLKADMQLMIYQPKK